MKKFFVLAAGAAALTFTACKKDESTPNNPNNGGTAKLLKKVTKTEKSKLVGSAIARKATELGVSTVVFDRGGYIHHGRVKAVAEGAREGGLQF